MKIQLQGKWSYWWYFSTNLFLCSQTLVVLKTSEFAVTITVICVFKTTSILSVSVWRYFIIFVAMDGCQIIESSWLPFVFSWHTFTTILNATSGHVCFIAIEMLVAFIWVLVVSGRTPVLSYLWRPGCYCRPRPFPLHASWLWHMYIAAHSWRSCRPVKSPRNSPELTSRLGLLCEDS